MGSLLGDGGNGKGHGGSGAPDSVMRSTTIAVGAKRPRKLDEGEGVDVGGGVESKRCATM